MCRLWSNSVRTQVQISSIMAIAQSTTYIYLHRNADNIIIIIVPNARPCGLSSLDGCAEKYNNTSVEHGRVKTLPFPEI